MIERTPEDDMTTSKVVSRASACFTWLSVVALAGSTLGCSPSHDDGGDGGEPGGPGGHGGSTSHVDGGGGGQRDAAGGGGAGASGGAGGAAGSPTGSAGAAGAPVTACTNACSAGATRCASGTTLEVCGVGANGCTSFVATTCPGGTVCERTAPADCVDPEWAEWPMSNGRPEVAAGEPNLQSLVDNLDGTVSDKNTGLMWEQAYHRPLGEFLGFCETQVTTGGYTDWRLPTIIELISIADLTRDPPHLDTTVFPLDNNGPFWSATQRKGFGDSLDIIDYWGGLATGEAPFIASSAGAGSDGPIAENLRCVR
jgi:Protein of unknown function (DUF1566)